MEDNKQFDQEMRALFAEMPLESVSEGFASQVMEKVNLPEVQLSVVPEMAAWKRWVIGSGVAVFVIVVGILLSMNAGLTFSDLNFLPKYIEQFSVSFKFSRNLVMMIGGSLMMGVVFIIERALHHKIVRGDKQGKQSVLYTLI